MKVSSKTKYCVIIPAYNAASYLDNLLLRLKKIVSAEDILVVDDGSIDDTFIIAERFEVGVIKHNRNLGKGAALRTAFNQMLKDDYEVAVTIDADLQHPPELIPEFIAKIEDGADIAVGNRMHNISAMPLERRVSNFLSTLATSILAGEKILDSQCGFRAIKRWVIQNAKLLCDKYQHESEMLIEAARMGAKIKFVNIPTIYNGNKSYFHPAIDTARFLSFLIMYYPQRWLRR